MRSGRPPRAVVYSPRRFSRKKRIDYPLAPPPLTQTVNVFGIFRGLCTSPVGIPGTVRDEGYCGHRDVVGGSDNELFDCDGEELYAEPDLPPVELRLWPTGKNNRRTDSVLWPYLIPTESALWLQRHFTHFPFCLECLY